MIDAPPKVPTQPSHGWTDQQVEARIGRVLQIGVLVSAVVAAVGGGMILVHYGGNPADFRRFAGEPRDLTGVGPILRAAFAGEGRAIAQLGMLLLIATPVARVAFTLGAFVFQRDKLYVAITSVVLALLLYGLLGGKA